LKKALVVGVGPLNGLGAQLCKKIAQNNFEVFVAGKMPALRCESVHLRDHWTPNRS